MRRHLAERLACPGVAVARLPVPSAIALGLVVVIVAVAIFAPVLTVHDPLDPGTPAAPPDGDHWFGTDRNGRDVFARLVYGARSSLIIGLGATLVALLCAAVVGSVAATSRRWINESIMRSLDVVMAFPGIILAAFFVTVFGPSVPILVLTIAILYVPALSRIVRANVLAQFGEDYVAAERVIGANRTFILARHVARNCAAPVAVFATVLVADAIVLEASLSFIGAGVQPPSPSWGNVIADGRSLVLSGGWWATFFPGMAILITSLALNILAESLTDAWANPRSRTRPDADHTAVPSPPSSTPERLGTSPEPNLETDLTRVCEVVEERGRSAGALPPANQPVLLDVDDLRIRFPARHGDIAVVDGVDLSVCAGETVGLVGESGCGKSLTSLAIMGLLPRGAQVAGAIRFDGRDVLAAGTRRWSRLRGHEMAMVYQDALSSLNPSMLIQSQLEQLTRRGGTRTPAELLELVHLSPARTLRSYPHELSGGQRQRVLIAMALSREPRLIVADEPTTALDVTVQAQVVELIAELRRELGFAMILVSHDLALVSELVDRIAVMYAGHLCESGPVSQVLGSPQHRYTRGLLGSVLSVETHAERLHQIPGSVPAPAEFGSGCRFAPRCAAATDACRTDRPISILGGVDGRHAYACHHPVAGNTSPAAASLGGEQ